LLALLLSASLSVLTYQLARRYLIDQRRDLAVRQASVNAVVAKGVLSTPSADPASLLTSLGTSTGSRALVRVNGKWFAAAVTIGAEQVPTRLVELADGGSPATQRTVIGNTPYQVIAFPLPDIDAVYVEFASLRELDKTLGTLASALLVAAGVTTIGGALAGWWASGRIIRPLGEVAQAARAISAGDLHTRLHVIDPDLRPLADSFNAMTVALEERIGREMRFTSDVSHELRTPLTVMTSAVNLAQRSELPERARMAVDVLAAHVAGLRQLVVDLLEISRIDAGGSPLELATTDLRSLITGVLASHEVPTDLVRDDRHDQRPCLVDRRRFERVIANLVENAGRYGEGLTMIRLSDCGESVVVQVDDQGPGVAPSERQAIFGRFHRGRAAARPDSPKGTGLGLALVEEHVRLHGGTIHVTDAPGGGARFEVEIPRRWPDQ
jgi:signal transduction histidine kinase